MSIRLIKQRSPSHGYELRLDLKGLWVASCGLWLIIFNIPKKEFTRQDPLISYKFFFLYRSFIFLLANTSTFGLFRTVPRHIEPTPSNTCSRFNLF